ncbi:MAG: hypothetical protein V4610_25255, partial [Pseudomonadota bacterium]
KRLIDGIIQDRMGHPDLEFAWDENREIDPEIQAKIHVDKVKNALETINEARADFGQDPVEGGDEPIFITAGGPVLLRDVIAGHYLPAPGPTGEGAGAGGVPGANPSAAKAADGVAQISKGVAKTGSSPFGESVSDALADSDVPDSFQDKVADFLDAAAATAAAAVTPHESSKTLDAAAIAVIVAVAIAGLNWRFLAVDIKPYLIAAAKIARDDSLGELGVTLTADQLAEFDRITAAWVDTRAQELAAQLTSSTPGLLRADLEAALSEHNTIDSLADVVRQGRAFSRDRAALIAEYETINVHHAATLRAFAAAGVRSVRWATVGDDHVEGICEANEAASPVPIGTAFPSGDHRPPAHIGCRCWIEAGP